MASRQAHRSHQVRRDLRKLPTDLSDVPPKGSPTSNRITKGMRQRTYDGFGLLLSPLPPPVPSFELCPPLPVLLAVAEISNLRRVGGRHFSRAGDNSSVTSEFNPMTSFPFCDS